MKVGHLTENFLPFNQVYIYETLRALETIRTESYVFTLKHTNREAFPFQNVFAFHSLSLFRRNWYRAQALMQGFSSFGIPFWSKIIQRAKIDLIHCHFLWTALAGLELKRRFGVPLCVTSYGEDKVFLADRRAEAYEEFITKLQIISDNADVMMTPSKYLLTLLLNLGVSAKKVKLWRIGVDISKFGKVKSTHREKIRVLMVGRMIHRKGVPYLVKAIPKIVREFKDVEFLLVGDGDEKPLVKALTQKLKVQRYVKILGHQPSIVKYYESSDIFVLPSIVTERGITEGLGIVLLESQASALPVVATRVGGVPEAVVDKKTGLLVEPENSEQIAEAILLLLRDEELRNTLGRNGRIHVSENFNLKKQSEILLNVYQGLL